MKKMTFVAFALALALSLTACGASEQEQISGETQETTDISAAETGDSEIESDNSIDNENSMTSQNATVTSIRWRRVVGSKIWYEVSYLLDEGEDAKEGYMTLRGLFLQKNPHHFMNPKLPT